MSVQYMSKDGLVDVYVTDITDCLFVYIIGEQYNTAVLDNWMQFFARSAGYLLSTECLFLSACLWQH